MGGLFGVEKVEPDPLNLLVNTDVGKQCRNAKDACPFCEHLFFVLVGRLHVVCCAPGKVNIK